ncbi:MAG: anhydro-N-acetylmuramic acid kinase, partial [Rhodospirillaceae bacterium]|nr:anhydro-N-acetylmuramic acid kinase [Rhodospirillaceae bacterium]
MPTDLKKLAENRPLRAIGLMSGTSMDGIDAAWLDTDGHAVQAFGPAVSLAYTPAFRARLHGFVSGVPEKDHPAAVEIEAELTRLHAGAVRAVMEKARATPDVVGFHGQTIWHRPQVRQTWQMGDGKALARALDLPVVYDFRGNDVAQGGQGAPLLPLFHAALAATMPKPIGILNVGGVSNITWISEKAASGSNALPVAIVGFDTGPGNALLDDWMLKHTGQAMDADGAMARQGRVDAGLLARLMAHPFFAAPPPKSLDRL